MAADPIPAVREDAATGATAAIFADLRATLGVPFVNLIWRHLATMPGMLEWTWALVKPLQASDGIVARGGHALRCDAGGATRKRCWLLRPASREFHRESDTRDDKSRISSGNCQM